MGLTSKARTVQLVKPVDPDVAALTGDKAIPIGNPETTIVTDPAAFVEGSPDPNVQWVDQDYLKAKGIYPLQVKTVEFISSMTKLGSAAGALVALAVFLFSRRRLCGAGHASAPVR